MFADIKHGHISKQNTIYQRNKKICESFLKILWREGFIIGYQKDKQNLHLIKIFLKYKNGKPAINNIRLITKPGRRIYCNIRQIWKINSYENCCIIFSTNKGLKTIDECKRLKIGGEPFIFIN
jgi:small subunit ribosomal protein S8